MSRIYEALKKAEQDRAAMQIPAQSAYAANATDSDFGANRNLVLVPSVPRENVWPVDWFRASESV